MFKSIFNLYTTCFIVFASTVSQAQQCGLSEDKIKEISWSIFCGEFEHVQSQFSQGFSVRIAIDDYNKMKKYCESGPSATNLAKVGLTAAAFTLASEFFINSALVKRMLPLVTEAAIDSYMSAVGFTKQSLRDTAGRFGISEAETVKNMRESIRQELARTYLYNSGYSSNVRAPGSLSRIALIGTEVTEQAFQKAETKLWMETHRDKIFREFMSQGDGPSAQQILNKGQKDSVDLAKKYVSSAAFHQESKAAGASFSKLLGNLKLPMKAPIRMAAVAGPVGLAASVLIGALEPSALGCSDKPDVNRIIARDKEEKCKPIAGISPQVIYGLTNPIETKSILDTDKPACLAYARIYQEKVLGLPANAEEKFQIKNSEPNDCQISWVNGDIQGYRLTRKDDQITLYYRPASKSGGAFAPWKEARTASFAKSRDVLVREMAAACEGKESAFFTQFLSPGPSAVGEAVPDVRN